MLAICEVAGNQYLIRQGERIRTEKIQKEKGETLHVEKVLMVSENEKTEIGQPYIPGYTVDFEVLEHGRGEKIRVFKMKAKKRYQRTIGHRQAYSELLVKEILKTEAAMKVKAPTEITSAPKIEKAAPQTLPLPEMSTEIPMPEKPKRKRSVKKAEGTLEEATKSETMKDATVKPKAPRKRAAKTITDL